jgi:hypothetical protein
MFSTESDVEGGKSPISIAIENDFLDDNTGSILFHTHNMISSLSLFMDDIKDIHTDIEKSIKKKEYDNRYTETENSRQISENSSTQSSMRLNSGDKGNEDKKLSDDNLKKFRSISRSNSNSVVPESLVMNNPQAGRKNKINSVRVISPSFVVPEIGRGSHDSHQDGDAHSEGSNGTGTTVDSAGNDVPGPNATFSSSILAALSFTSNSNLPQQDGNSRKDTGSVIHPMVFNTGTIFAFFVFFTHSV